MIAQYRDLEIAVNSKGYFDSVYNGILWKRRWLIMGIAMSITSNLIVLLFRNAISLQLKVLSIFLPLLIFILVANILRIIEIFMLRNYNSREYKSKLSRLRNIFIVNEIAFMFALVYSINTTSSLRNSSFTLIDMLINFILVLIFSFIFGIIYSSFTFMKVKEEILKKGLLN
jgi:hypothetical protein